MHRLVLNTLINILIVIIALTGAWHFVTEKYLELPLWLSIIMASVAMCAVFYNVYGEFMQDYINMRLEKKQ